MVQVWNPLDAYLSRRTSRQGLAWSFPFSTAQPNAAERYESRLFAAPCLSPAASRMILIFCRVRSGKGQCRISRPAFFEDHSHATFQNLSARAL
jgi:hypothetical protein